jgi:hypothetical protein
MGVSGGCPYLNFFLTVHHGWINDIPVEVILSWPRPNYENLETRGNAFLAVTTLFLVLAALFVGLRIYSRVIV